jgi:20S proteasome alpha/beta subunit
MTIIIGVQARNGIALISDCLIDQGTLTEKIYEQLYVGTSEGGRHAQILPNIRGTYIAGCGRVGQPEAYHEFKQLVYVQDNALDYLTDPRLRESEVDQLEANFNEMRRNFNQDIGQERNPGVDDLYSLLVAKKLQQHSANRFDSYIFLRMNGEQAPDLVHLDTGNIGYGKPFAVNGSGIEYVGNHFQNYTLDVDVDEAIKFAFTGLNKALKAESKFKGVQLVKISNLGNGFRIQRGMDKSTNFASLEDLELNDRFQPITSRSKNPEELFNIFQEP